MIEQSLIDNLRYVVRTVRGHYSVAAFESAGAAHRMMTHENAHAEACGHKGRLPKYEVFDAKDECVITWGVKRSSTTKN